MTFDPTNLATFEELQKIILRLELDSRAKVLPAHWTPWRQPVPALPIDEFITTLAGRKRKPRVRSPDELGCYRLGECPYAMARAGVAKAINFATLHDNLEDLKAFTTSKLKDLKTEPPALESGLLSAINHVSSINSSQERYHELDFGKLLILQDRLIATLFAIRDSMPQIEALHQPCFNSAAYFSLNSASTSSKLWRPQTID